MTAQPVGPASGFTLIELLVVVALIAIASATVSLALRDPAATRLDRDAARLVALLESARTEARSAGIDVRWVPSSGVDGQNGFRFIGLPASAEAPDRWLDNDVRADVIGARAVQLGPEPIIAAQRIVLSLDTQRVTVATDGLGPFAVATEAADASPPP